MHFLLDRMGNFSTIARTCRLDLSTEMMRQRTVLALLMIPLSLLIKSSDFVMQEIIPQFSSEQEKILTKKKKKKIKFYSDIQSLKLSWFMFLSCTLLGHHLYSAVPTLREANRSLAVRRTPVIY